ncbi:electron transfer flavoprotein beta subunit lysine methyltransferase-like [Lingula anatina]|uniref:ETFB lysine methyltransferase n=1 Tax=Lingula anatina TaxID=7574 RepID=A0A1S3HVU2_LINAN|nr:electron transfer flavoprotein beta subunit lysine methyltransferase-like [Lingula anatina]|eukprot:XP_013390162.1 electron transfer flavoprotein beta subunit lysine methyltransferase-like [Lingula anatina]
MKSLSDSLLETNYTAKARHGSDSMMNLTRRIKIFSKSPLSEVAKRKRSGTYQCCTQQNHNASRSLDYRELIKKHTEVTTNHLTPELQLHLITPTCPLWYTGIADCIFSDPYWAFYWPGGQALTRYLLDNGKEVADKVVADIGSGCGASAIAAAMMGAKQVLANDIDPVAALAIQMNAELNGVYPNIEISTENLIGHSKHWDFLLLGDMFYDKDISDRVLEWMDMLAGQNTKIFVGDPCRIYMLDHPIRTKLRLIAEYDLTDECKEENYGLSSGFVWEFIP